MISTTLAREIYSAELKRHTFIADCYRFLRGVHQEFMVTMIDFFIQNMF